MFLHVENRHFALIITNRQVLAIRGNVATPGVANVLFGDNEIERAI
jgi:hypothetical protein